MSKIKLCKQAENLYIEEGLSVDNICQNLDVARRTIFYWKKKYEWNKIRYKKHKSEIKFSTELMDMAIKFMKQISKNIDGKTQTSQAEYYTLLKLIKNIPKIKKIRKRPCIKFRNTKIRIKILLTEIYTTCSERYFRLGNRQNILIYATL